MGLRNGSYVCDICWSTLFSFDNFQIALAAADSDNHAGPLKGGFSYTTHTWKEIDDGENAGCNWCDFLWGDILEYRKCNRNQSLRTEEFPPDDERWKVTVSFKKEHKAPHHLSLRLVIDDDFPTTYAVHAHPDDNAASVVTGRNILWEVSSKESYQLATACLEECISTHDACQRPQDKIKKTTLLPTRVVDCTDPQKPKLVTTSQLQGSSSPYAALSYVWGQAQPHSTCTTNIDAYLVGIPVAQLPQTIQDAIICTHNLGLRYLWTDTLCILQDSVQDKNREISQMCNIYQSAHITIIAASANKAGDGFLHNRKNPVVTELPFWCPDGSLGTVFVRDSESAPRNEPINQRAWCFQERLLSPRALIYASHTVQYQCQAGIKNVGDANNFDAWKGTDDLRLPEPSSSSGDSRAIWNAWKTILSDYTRRAVTSPDDRLVALSGVAQLFQQRWSTETVYIAGLWKHSLSQDLIWHRSKPSARRKSSNTAGYRAPSWSWAATEGHIDSHGWPGIIQPEWEIKHCEVVPTSQGLVFGQIKGGSLEVEAILRRVGWELSPDNASCPLFERAENGALSEEIGFVYLDSSDVVDKEGFAVVVGSINKKVLHHLVGLVLVPVIDARHRYRRVGLFDVHEKILDEDWGDEPFCDIGEWLNTPRQVITII